MVNESPFFLENAILFKSIDHDGYDLNVSIYNKTTFFLKKKLMNYFCYLILGCQFLGILLKIENRRINLIALNSITF
jgi:hypothetical protein